MFTDLIYITKVRALEVGLTHEGHMFGVPAWFEDDGKNADEFFACTPKIPVLHLWCMLVDALLEVGSHFISGDKVLISPITVRGRIK